MTGKKERMACTQQDTIYLPVKRNYSHGLPIAYADCPTLSPLEVPTSMGSRNVYM